VNPGSTPKNTNNGLTVIHRGDGLARHVLDAQERAALTGR